MSEKLLQYVLCSDTFLMKCHTIRTIIKVKKKKKEKYMFASNVVHLYIEM